MSASDDELYQISETSAGHASDQEEDISDIINGVDLLGIREYLMSQIQPPNLDHVFHTGPRGEVFNKYLPLWMNPMHRPYPLRHPALRSDDKWKVGEEWKLPSEYAKRYGPDIRAPADNPGRSMLSPTNQDPSLDWAEDLQSRVFHGYTADELKSQGAFDPDMHIDESLDGLRSPLHPIVGRANWIQPDEGSSAERSLLWYNLDGTDQRWDAAANDTLWEALQPVLQLISKVLYSDHPFWRSILDIYKISPIDTSRIPERPMDDDGQPISVGPSMHDFLWDHICTLHYEVEDRDMFPEAIALRGSGFQSAKVAEHILRTYVRFRFADTASKGAYAYTTLYREIPSPAPRCQIMISVSPDVMWPLLLPSYSKSEKFVTCTTLASVILHELAHSARNTVAIMTETQDWHTDPALATPRPDSDGPIQLDLVQPTRLQQALLESLGQKIGGLSYGVGYPQFYFENEHRSEEGWAFENQLWGGIATTIPELAPKQGFPHVISWLQQWPYPRSNPRPYFRSNEPVCGEFDQYGWPNWLFDPPPSVVRRVTALPVTMMSRLFAEDFWATDVARYSHQALKFPIHEWEGQPLKSALFFSFIPVEQLRAAFRNHDAFTWLAMAVQTLLDGGEGVLSEYMWLRTTQAAGPVVVRTRLHYERKRWRTSDAALEAKGDEIERLRAASVVRLAQYRAINDSPNDQARHLELYYDQARLVVAAARELARMAGWEISAMQLWVSECARLEHEARRGVKRYLDSAGLRIEQKFTPILGRAVSTVSDLMHECGELVGSSAAGSEPLRDRTMSAYMGLTSIRELVDELAKSVDTVVLFDPTLHENYSDIHKSFTLLADRTSGRLHRLGVQRLAERRINELPGDSPILTVMTAVCRILNRC